ncbi:SCO2 protein, partial [Rhinopomastus cyanomelas]|nr:SCO2 protein [Rhinopomastus cyanomelas]
GSPHPLPLRQRALVVLGASLCAGGGWLYLRRAKQQAQRAQRAADLRALALGQGNFELQDPEGRTRRKSDFRGRWVLLYFGFTHCPDICPEELEKLSEVVTLLDERRQPQQPEVQPLFITVDPERDDGAALRRYLRDFHPRLLGLTGSAEAVQQVRKAFRVYASTGPKDADGDYAVDHTVLIYLLAPDGLLYDCYNRSKSAAAIAHSVSSHMENYEPLL